MKILGLEITLLEDCVFSASSATAGAHASLDRVPGQALLGAAAARLYARFEPAMAFRAFHSGALRFGDGLPRVGRETALPVPVAWHHAKEDRPVGDDQRLNPARIHNFLQVRELPGGKQPQQMRNGFVTRDGRLIEPQHELRLKTAIDPDTGRAAEAQLFGYDALTRGQTFMATLEADDDLEDALFEEVAQALEGEQLLGRSRSAEYGRVHIRAVETEPPAPGPATGNEVILWLLSDLALQDTHGFPTLDPRPEYLGLGSGRVAYERSFLRHRRYAPWNAFRRGHDREREVLCAGSVITLALDVPPTAESLATLEQGAGLFREAGLGRVKVNPELLRQPQPVFGTPGPAVDRPCPPRPEHPLVAWLEARDEDRELRIHQAVRKAADAYAGLLERGRRMQGLRPDDAFGPSASQWGHVREQARGSRARNLSERLFDSDRGAARASMENWKDTAPWSDGSTATFSQWLGEQIKASGLDERDRERFVAGLARELMDLARTSGHSNRKEARHESA
ncbi:hypothetical protein [Thioalkalivibrio sp. AKL10]|uniref:hypothetical protein n=1 Tax=Thioalkalivibrio sp. AKL10 TaxID=1158158 RepID=UPI0003602E08|nr:hypothetical protein [Thioalkalivibrio sp. AKL10]